jgi:hypothetical protein
MFGNLDVRDRVSCEEFQPESIDSHVLEMTAEEVAEWISHMLESQDRFVLDTENWPTSTVDLIFGNGTCPEDLPF